MAASQLVTLPCLLYGMIAGTVATLSARGGSECSEHREPFSVFFLLRKSFSRSGMCCAVVGTFSSGGKRRTVVFRAV